MREVAALHTRLVPGFVVATDMIAPRVRRATFASGTVLDERIVTVDDAAMRLVWSIVGEGVEHYNGATQVFAAAAGARVVWTADVLPDALAEQFAPLMTAGMATMKEHLEGSLAGA